MFDKIGLKWQYVAQIHLLMNGEAQSGPLGCLSAKPLVINKKP